MRITAAVLQGLQPFMNEVRDDLTTLKECLTSLNETIIQLSGDLEEHKNWTKSELADLQTSLQSSIDNPPTEMISRAVLQTLQPYLNNIEENITTDLSSLIGDRIDESVSSLSEEQKNQMTSLKECLNKTLSQLSEDLEEHKFWTRSELGNLQTSLQSSIDDLPYNVLLTLLPNLTNLSLLISERAASANVTVSSLMKDIKEHENKTTSELNYLQSSINTTLCHKVEELKDTITSLPVHTCGGTEDWRRAVYLDMRDPSTDCPSGWRETGYSKRTCGRASDGQYTCDSATFPVSGGEYTVMCVVESRHTSGG